MDKGQVTANDASQRLKRQKFEITGGKNNYIVEIKASETKDSKRRIKNNRVAEFSPQRRDWLRLNRFHEAKKNQQERSFDNGKDVNWWPVETYSKVTGFSERISGHESEKSHQPQTEEDKLVEDALRKLREASESDDGGIEKKLEQLPPSFWQKVSSKIRVKVPLICNVFETHELAVENLLQTYLNVIGLAAHKGIKKYCMIIKSRANKGRVSHDGEGESTEPKASLLVRFFNFINSRLESFLGLSSEMDDLPDTSSFDEPVEDSKNLVFHTNKLNLILFPPSMEKVHKVIEEEDGKKNEDITGKELQNELWKGTEGHTTEVIEADNSSEITSNSQRKCLGTSCVLRGTRHTHAQDLEDEYLNDYYEERRRLLDAEKEYRKKYQDDNDLDLEPPYDINLLDPEPNDINNDIPTLPPAWKDKIKEENEEFGQPTREPPPETTPIVEILTSEAFFPTTTETEDIQPAIGDVHIGRTTAAPQIFAMTLPVKLLIFIPISILVLILLIILLYIIAHRKRKKSIYDYNGDEEAFDDGGRERFGGKRIYISDVDTSDGLDGPPEFRRPPSVLQEKGEKKSRSQSYKDDFVPVGPKKKKRFLRKSKK